MVHIGLGRADRNLVTVGVEQMMNRADFGNTVEGVTFAEFNDECARMAAIGTSLHRSEDFWDPRAIHSNTQYADLDPVLFPSQPIWLDHRGSWVEYEDYYIGSHARYVVINDADGSLTGTGGPSYLINNPNIMYDDHCEYRSAMGGYLCVNSCFRLIETEFQENVPNGQLRQGSIAHTWFDGEQSKTTTTLNHLIGRDDDEFEENSGDPSIFFTLLPADEPILLEVDAPHGYPASMLLRSKGNPFSEGRCDGQIIIRVAASSDSFVWRPVKVEDAIPPCDTSQIMTKPTLDYICVEGKLVLEVRFSSTQDMELELEHVTAPQGVPCTGQPIQHMCDLLPSSHVWRAIADGSVRSTFMQPAYDDSLWPHVGSGRFGFATWPLVDVEVPQVSLTGLTIYFRTTFTWDTTYCINNIILRVRFDDGLRCFVNGVQDINENLPAGSIDDNTESDSGKDSSERETWNDLTLSLQHFNTGHGDENVIACELHNQAIWSYDMLFEAVVVAETDNQCDVDCEVGPFGPFGACVKQAHGEDGVQWRRRHVQIAPQNNGEDCPGLWDSQVYCVLSV